MGKKVARTVDTLKHTHDLSDRLVRLPLWPGLEEHLATVIDSVITAITP